VLRATRPARACRRGPPPQLEAHVCTRTLRGFLRATVGLWSSTSGNHWDSGPVPVRRGPNPPKSWAGTLSLRAWEAVRRLYPTGGSPKASLKEHRKDVAEVLLRELLGVAADGELPAAPTCVTLQEQPATLEGYAAMSRFLAERVPHDERRFTWTRLSLAGPFVAVQELQSLLPDAAASVVVAPYQKEVADLDRHAWQPRALAACRDPSALLLVTDNRGAECTQLCLKEALSMGCTKPLPHRTKVTLVNSDNMLPQDGPVWATGIRNQLMPVVTMYRDTAPLSDEERAALDTFQLHSVAFSKPRFENLLRLAEADALRGGKLSRAKDFVFTAANTGATELLGFLQCSVMDTEMVLVRNLDAQAERELAAYVSTEALDASDPDVIAAMDEVMMLCKATNANGAPNTQARRDLVQRMEQGLRTEVAGLVNAAWGQAAATSGLEELRLAAIAQRASYVADSALTLQAALQPLLKWYRNRASAAWAAIVDGCVSGGVQRLRVMQGALPADVVNSLDSDARQLLSGHGNNAVGQLLLLCHQLQDSPFLYLARTAPMDNVHAPRRVELLDKDRIARICEGAVLSNPDSRGAQFDMMREYIMQQVDGALHSHVRPAQGRHVFPEHYVPLLKAAFELAHKHRGQCFVAAQARRGADAQVQKFMKEQLETFRQCCAYYRAEQPARERLRGWALLDKAQRVATLVEENAARVAAASTAEAEVEVVEVERNVRQRMH
jgi:hypothetical protein